MQAKPCPAHLVMKKMMPKHFVVLCLYKGSGDEMLLSLPSFSLALAAWDFFYAVLSGTSPLQEDIQASPSSIQKMEKYVRSSMRFNISQGSAPGDNIMTLQSGWLEERIAEVLQDYFVWWFCSSLFKARTNYVMML